MKMKHTEGKWVIRKCGNDLDISSERGNMTTPTLIIVRPILNKVVGGTQEANANLIAAAPELLKAIKPLIARIKAEDPWAKDYDQTKYAESVVAKAEGK